ncbi:ankyrin repeat-containing domain protein [Rhypophila decipiens]|uniref:Ankyrin repeat-containing domain protein n=1 Tax=Rhypophila decipiens TaxID=261697 RepID=A0AAN6XY83_9PEZI|nr:ankyrin repeat-containing domain protein [Rhypophila decipiens]
MVEIYQTVATGERPQSFTPLMVASYFGLSIVIEQLLKAGADANAKDNDGWTPLHWASENDHDAVVQQLFEAGADANANDGYDWTPHQMCRIRL